MILEPKRSYILDLVDFSEDDPLLRFAAYASIVTGISTLLVGFLACCGAIKAERCMVVSFLIFLVFIFFAEISIGVLGILYREKFTGDRMEVYLSNMSHNRYYRDKWVLPLMDTIQFYQQCCGGKGPMDYYDSYWYITNTMHGTRSFVPPSCCKQSQEGRAWSIQPIDPMCTTYVYYTTSFNNSVNIQGCHERLQHWFNEQTILFAAIGFAFAAFQIIGMCVSVVLWRRINDYLYVDSYER
uniref:Tetraspanin n=1 Tax=Acrobeloides nanus TaxID=290746 RepID=A0A914E103_9BILA